MKRLIQISTALIFTAISISPVFATSIVSTSPTAGSILSVSPTAITVKANANLANGVNDLSVTDPKGVRVDDGSIQIQGPVLMVGLKALTISGLYTVSYTLMALDDSPITGSFTFLYNAPAEMTLPTPAPTDTTVALPTANKATDIFVIGLMVFAFIVLIFLSRYARKTFAPTAKSPKVPRKNSRSKKFLK
jgi:methionine-rich copper-binding protein CopC